MYGYGFTMMFNSATAAIKAVADVLFNRLSEDGINRMTEDNQQRIIEERHGSKDIRLNA
jgi:hypothetical protein